MSRFQHRAQCAPGSPVRDLSKMHDLEEELEPDDGSPWKSGWKAAGISRCALALHYLSRIYYAACSVEGASVVQG